LAKGKLEARIDELRKLRVGGPAAGVEEILRKALSDRSNLIVAEAAKTIGELSLDSLVPQLLSAFDRQFEDPAKTDPKCWGKTAVVKALVKLDYSESPPFLRGLRHVQLEAGYGGREDSAAQLRSNCALALVQCRDLHRYEILACLVDAMSDPEDAVRIEAVRALNQLGGDESMLLLRLKARVGDRRHVIIGQVFDSLLSLERDRAVPFVAEYLNSRDEEQRDEAALALGSSRLGTALKVLTKSWQNAHSESFSTVLLRAISSSRLPEAIEFLLDVLRRGSPRQAAAALESLKLHEGSSSLQPLIEEAKKSRSQSPDK
jgi:HEAT repeat protein